MRRKSKRSLFWFAFVDILASIRVFAVPKGIISERYCYVGININNPKTVNAASVGIASGHPPGVISRSLLSSNIKRQHRNKQTRSEQNTMVKIILPFILLVGVLSEVSAQSCDESKTPEESAEFRGCYWSSRGQCKKFHRCGSLLTKGDCQLYGAHMCFWSWQKKCVAEYEYDNDEDENLPTNKNNDVDVSADITSGSQPSQYTLELVNAMARAPSNSGRND